ncbi:MAG: antitoxin [Chloroflexi bacterium CFX6]|nr:antitoxin [Chloroflexi bacterium CFX6]
MTARFAVLVQRLWADWGEAKQASGKAQRFLLLALRGGPDSEAFLEAAALNLHGFYNGLERIFEWLAREFDGGPPQGATWHRDLLDQMTLDIPGVRPAVLDASTGAVLAEYLGFRHLVRNLYTWNFAPLKVQQLVERMSSVLDAVEADFERFAAFLAAAARADASE